ncbi:MAG: hypothetical protein ACOYD6_01430 [Limnochordia bacterium]|jgi:hypothetical protein
MSLNNVAIFYPLWAFGLMVISLILVPRREYSILLPHGFIGSLLGFIVLYIGSNILGAWSYVKAEPFVFLGVPAFIIAAWGASAIIFLWALPFHAPQWVHYLYILLFALAGGAIDDLFHQMGLRVYSPNYRWWMWVPAVFFIFWSSYQVYLWRLHLPTGLGGKQPND